MSVTRKRYEIRFSSEDHAALAGLAKLMGVTPAQALRLAVREKLRRMRAKQKPVEETGVAA